MSTRFMPMEDPNILDARFGRAGELVVHEGPGGLTVVEVTNTQSSARMTLQGAHLIDWVPRGERPVLWLSERAKFAPGASIRGGIPVCWPWFGPHPTGEPGPSHGFARTSTWELVATETGEGKSTEIALRLGSTPATQPHWPHSMAVHMHLSIGRALQCELVTRNSGTQPVTISQALHTYFAVGDVRETSVEGLAGCTYIDKVDGGKRKEQFGNVHVDSEIDRIFLESDGDCVVRDPVWKRCIRVSKRGSRSTVVWNPWAEKSAAMSDMDDEGYLHMLCVECTNAADDVVTIPPGGEHRLWVRYDVEAL